MKYLFLFLIFSNTATAMIDLSYCEAPLNQTDFYSLHKKKNWIWKLDENGKLLINNTSIAKAKISYVKTDQAIFFKWNPEQDELVLKLDSLGRLIESNGKTSSEYGSTKLTTTYSYKGEKCVPKSQVYVDEAGEESIQFDLKKCKKIFEKKNPSNEEKLFLVKCKTNLSPTYNRNNFDTLVKDPQIWAPNSATESQVESLPSNSGR